MICRDVPGDANIQLDPEKFHDCVSKIMHFQPARRSLIQCCHQIVTLYRDGCLRSVVFPRQGPKLH